MAPLDSRGLLCLLANLSILSLTKQLGKQAHWIWGSCDLLLRDRRCLLQDTTTVSLKFNASLKVKEEGTVGPELPDHISF